MKKDIADRLRAVTQGITIVPGTVKAVEEGNATCSVEPTDDTIPTLEAVRLRPLLDTSQKGFYGIPEQGANVLAIAIDQEQYSLLSCDNYKEIILRSPELGGLVKVEELTRQLNALEQKVNSILNALKTHIHPTPSGPSSPSADFVSISPLSESQRADLENENAKHG